MSGIELREGVGKREFPVAELFKPRGLKERSDRFVFRSPAPSKSLCPRDRDFYFVCELRSEIEGREFLKNKSGKFLASRHMTAIAWSFRR